jgi:hypothetical protein
MRHGADAGFATPAWRERQPAATGRRSGAEAVRGQVDERPEDIEDSLEELTRYLAERTGRPSESRRGAFSDSASDPAPDEVRIPKPFSATDEPAPREADQYDEGSLRALRRVLYEAKRSPAAPSPSAPTYEWPELSSEEARLRALFASDPRQTHERAEKIRADPPPLSQCRPRKGQYARRSAPPPDVEWASLPPKKEAPPPAPETAAAKTEQRPTTAGAGLHLQKPPAAAAAQPAPKWGARKQPGFGTQVGQKPAGAAPTQSRPSDAARGTKPGGLWVAPSGPKAGSLGPGAKPLGGDATFGSGLGFSFGKKPGAASEQPPPQPAQRPPPAVRHLGRSRQSRRVRRHRPATLRHSRLARIRPHTRQGS